MQKSMIRSVFASLAFIGVAAYSASPASGDLSTDDPFEGEWAVTATPDSDATNDGQGRFEEAVLFHEGQFSAAVFAMYGFTPSEYTVNYDTGHAVFSANLLSSDRGSLHWSGQLSLTGLNGILVWTHADGDTSRYVLRGDRQ